VKKGDIVILRKALLGNEIGTIGVCYEEYDLGGHKGASFIFENGSYDGFSENEQEHFLFVVGYNTITCSYKFLNALNLSEDFDEGYFDNTFDVSESKRMEYLQMLRESNIDSIID